MAAGLPVFDISALAALGGESLGGTAAAAAIVANDWLIDITGRGWLEKKRTSGSQTRYWYQRWRYRDESLGGKVRKRNVYLAPYLGNEGARQNGQVERHSR